MQDAHVTLILDRLGSIERSIENEKRDSSESRRRVYEKLETLDKKQDITDMRVEKLEQAITSMSPTVAEFLNYKAQVAGAGRLGKALWRLGGVILGAAAALSAYWSSIVLWIKTHL